MSVVKANVYVDGFSLYYSALKQTPYRWLDLRKLCRRLLPNCKPALSFRPRTRPIICPLP